ncbi:MAG: arsenate reductase (azurin) small subunit [Proteobacteria bacterium]|nr:arsenate reductase (azurin) small subunit [Pseudomonadota bacterium]
MTDNEIETDDGARPSRREFIVAGAAGAAGLVAAQALPGRAQAATGSAEAAAYPVVEVARLADLAPGATLDFAYPDDNSPALLIRLPEPADGGIGPEGDIVAFSILCTHKGCPVSYKPEHKMLICPCHWSTFDPAKAGVLVIGQASQGLPRIRLRIADDRIQAVGVDGLIYGRHTNIL